MLRLIIGAALLLAVTLSLLNTAVLRLGQSVESMELAYTTFNPALSTNTVELQAVNRGLMVTLYHGLGRIQGISWSADGETLYFDAARQRSHANELVALDVSRREMRWLTNTPESESAPHISPDGTQVVFQSYVDVRNDWDIYLLDLQSGEVMPLYEGISADSNPVWSPDGRTIAFETASVGRNSANIMLLNVQTGETDRITTRLDGQPAWSPDGEHLYYVSLNNMIFDIQRMRRDGSDTQTVITRTGGSTRPAPSPDGESLAFISGAVMTVGGQRYSGIPSVFISTIDGSDLRRTTSRPVIHNHPTWRPR